MAAGLIAGSDPDERVDAAGEIALHRAQLLSVAGLVGSRQPLAVVDELGDEIGLPASEAIRE